MNSCPDSHLLPLCPVACMFRMVSAKRKTAKLHNGVLRLEQVITFVKVLKLVQTWSAWWQRRRTNIEAAVLGRDISMISMVQNKLNTKCRTGKIHSIKTSIYVPCGSISQQESCHNVQLARFGARKGWLSEPSAKEPIAARA